MTISLNQSQNIAEVSMTISELKKKVTYIQRLTKPDDCFVKIMLNCAQAQWNIINASFHIWETHTWVHCLLSFFHLMLMTMTIQVSGLFSFLESLLHSSEVFHLSLLAFFFHYHFHHFLLLRCHPPAKRVDNQCILQRTIIYQSSIITGFLLNNL